MGDPGSNFKTKQNKLSSCVYVFGLKQSIYHFIYEDLSKRANCIFHPISRLLGSTGNKDFKCADSESSILNVQLR